MDLIVIPAREGSTRLKNKMLLDVCGKPLIRWTVENCLKVKGIKVAVATDSEKIANVLKDLDVKIFITPSNLKSGSDRIAYAVKNLNVNKIINVQGDEPLLDVKDIEKVIDALDFAPVSSLYFPIKKEEDFLNPNIVKVLMDKSDFALYFSRSPVPYGRDVNFEYLKEKGLANKHIGIYGYKKDILIDFAYNFEHSPLEDVEKLEQLRFLHYGIKIKMEKANKETLGVDTLQDYKNVCEILNKNVKN